MEQMKARLKELCGLTGISAREDEVVRYMKENLSRYSKQVTVDMLGNVTAYFPCGKEDAKKILFFGHMDEVGLIVKKVEENGYLRLERLSAVNSHIIPGSVWNVRTHDGKLIPGVVGAMSHHFMKAEDKAKVPELSQLALDIGCRSKEEVNALGISEGCVTSFMPQFIELANNMVSTKSVDDRAACAVLLGLAEYAASHPLSFDLYIIASVQEEFNIRGIMPAARAVDPDIAIGIDVTPAGDSPDLAGVSDIRLGGGPAFTYLNYHGRGTLNGLIPNEPLVHGLEDACRREGIPFQREVCRGLLTETCYIQISGNKGVATAGISIPIRYAHTPVEVVSVDDLIYTEKLLEAFCSGWDDSLNLYKV